MKKNFLKGFPKIFMATAFAVTLILPSQAGVMAPSINDYVSAVEASPISAQLGGYLQQVNTYNQAFMNMDMYMLSNKKDREAQKEAKAINEHGSMWVAPYGEFGTVHVHNAPNASNSLYGIFMGGESQLKDLGNGWEGMYGAYIGYNGSRQGHNNAATYQNGGTFGLTGMAFKNDFFAGATVNVGAGAGRHHTYFNDDDNFALLTTGVATKIGYNWELADGKFIIQPSLLASYSYVHTFDDWNSTGASIDSSGIHAFQVEPGLKFIGNLKNGWQPYAGVSLVYSIWDKNHATLTIPGGRGTTQNLSVNPYVRYGIGLRKVWGDRVAGYIQTYFMNGGRSGIGIHGGFRFALGRDGKHEISKAEDPSLAPTKVSLNNKK